MRLKIDVLGLTQANIKLRTETQQLNNNIVSTYAFAQTEVPLEAEILKNT